MSSASEFRRGIKLLIIMNSIFSTGLIEYFIDFNMNVIGIVYACFSIVLYVSLIYVFSFVTFNFAEERQLLIQITHRLYECNSYVSFIFFIIAGILRSKVKFFVYLIHSIYRYFLLLQNFSISLAEDKTFHVANRNLYSYHGTIQYSDEFV